MSATGPLSKAKRTSASDCRTIAIYEYTPWKRFPFALTERLPIL
jgi:hypothetical protein